jgi:phosphoglucosamine mutase
MMKRLFGTDGIRGRAGHYPTTPEVALALGKAIGTILRREPGKHRVVVGKDTRRSCYFFENAIIAGLCSMGIDTLMLGPIPTPGVAFITVAYRASAGIMISASHNPYYDNGIKIFDSQGYKLSDAIEEELEHIILTESFGPMPEDYEIGRNQRIDDVAGRYIEYVKATIPRGESLKGMKIFLDCAHGATYKVAPLAFWELGAEVIVQGNEPDGLNINRHCGAIHPENLQKGVLECQAHVGLAFDGDGDRLQMVDEKGQIVDGDQIMAICAKYLKDQGKLTNNMVVLTAMSNLGLINYLKAEGIEPVIAKVGDRNVIHQMLVNQAALGGEQSGHLILKEHSTTGDGIIAGLQVLNIMKQSGQTLSELAARFQKYPQVLINVPVAKKTPLNEIKKVQQIIREAETLLSGEGRVFVRYSGTENLCRVMVEGKEQGLIEILSKSIAKVIESELNVCAGFRVT